MGKYFELTDEIMLNAITFMPIEEKAELAKEIAKKCVVVIPTAEQNLEGEKFLALPYIKGEDRELKLLCLAKVLLDYYLNLSVEIPFDEKKYNFYAGGSILNQIERYKSNFDLKTRLLICLLTIKSLENSLTLK